MHFLICMENIVLIMMAIYADIIVVWSNKIHDSFLTCLLFTRFVC